MFAAAVPPEQRLPDPETAGRVSAHLAT
jgi:hypothetical protein